MAIYTLHLFAGAGGGILADMLLGHTPVGAIEIEEYPRRVLLQRQLDGLLPLFPIWDDVTTFREDNKETSQYIELLKENRRNLCISGGFPCQDISIAGGGEGIQEGTRSGLWFEMFRTISEIRPKYVFIENSSMLAVRGGTRVVADLASIGYDVKWCCMGGDHVGCDHKRSRMWMVANSRDFRVSRRNVESRETCSDLQRRQSSSLSWKVLDGAQFDGCEYKDMPQPCLAGVENDVAHRVDRLKAVGNGQISTVAQLAWKTLTQGE